MNDSESTDLTTPTVDRVLLRLGTPTKLVNDITDFCEANEIRRFRLFGSVLDDRFSAESDVDILVDFKGDKTPGYRFFALEIELSELFGRQVDLLTSGFLSDWIRSEVEKQALTVYAAN